MADIPIHYIWLASGVLCLFAEALGASGVGFLFAGLGALTSGILITLGHIPADGYAAQWVSFFIATAAWTAILWLPLKKLRSGKNASYTNMVGDTAFAGGNGITKQSGEATWSGTIMQARLAQDSAVEKVEAGAQVTIAAVSGATLIVKPKA